LRLSASSCSFVGDWEAFMPRVMRMLAAAMVLVFAGTMIEARTGEALAPAAKPTRAKKAKPVPRGAAVRPSSPDSLGLARLVVPRPLDRRRRRRLLTTGACG
jgi:hypothetical protein